MLSSITTLLQRVVNGVPSPDDMASSTSEQAEQQAHVQVEAEGAAQPRRSTRRAASLPQRYRQEAVAGPVRAVVRSVRRESVRR
jgi:hypothetical protein